MISNNVMEENLFIMYDDINLGSSSVCKECQEKTTNLSLPVSFWFVGSNYEHENGRVLFVGKNARGKPGEKRNNYYDGRNVAKELWNKSWAYWSYIRNITEEMYGENGADYIAYTNIIKCNNSSSTDNTSELVKDNCIRKMQVLRREIELLKPKRIIFLTSSGYDNYIKSIFNNVVDIENKKIQIGAKKMPWWEFSAYIENDNIKVLRVGHPERKKKVDYVNAIANWIKQK